MTTPTKIGLDTDPGWMTPYGKGDVEKEFDPNQPRDEQGRWTGEGGGGVAHDAATRERVTQMIKTERRKGNLDPSKWPEQKPWLATREEVEAGNVPGFRVRSQDWASNSTVLAANTTNSVGQITLYPNYFNQDPETRELVLYHELGHDVARTMGADKSMFPLLDMQRETHGDFASWSAYRWNQQEELISDAYQMISPAYRGGLPKDSWPEKGTTERYSINNMTMYHEIAKVARGLDLPIAKGFAEAEAEWFGKTKEFDPNQARDEQGRWTSEGTGEEYTVGGFAVWQPPVSSRRQVQASIREINKWPKNKDPWVPNTNNERMFGTAAFSVTQQDVTGSMGEPAAYLSLDLVRSTERGSNDVIRGMNELTKIADRHQVTIVLDAVSFNINEHFTPSPMSQEKLFKFYEHFGFRKTMPGVSNHMARAPKR